MSSAGSTTRSQVGAPFIGRKSELELLRTGLASALAGRGRVCSLMGEAGIGKTRLCQELGRLAEQQSCQVLWGRCWEGEESPPFWPWIQIFRNLRTRPGFTASGIDPLLEVGEPGSTLHPVPGRFRLFDAATRAVASVAVFAPLVLIFDDLHAADRSSLALLDFLAREIEQLPLLVVGSMRQPEMDLSSSGAEILSRLVSRGVRIPLSGFRREEIEEFLSRSCSITASSTMLEDLEHGTAGNPFFLSELAAGLVARREVSEAPGGGVAVPQGLRSSIRRRVDQLPGDARSLLETAATIGREFSFSLLAEADGLSREVVLGLLADLAAARMVDPAGFGLGPNRFVHALVRETIYQELPPARRLELHRRVGRAIEERFAHDLDSHLDSLAHHYAQAAALGESERAIRYSELAARRAESRLGYEEAAAHLGRALELAREHAWGAQMRCDLLVALGEAQRKAGQIAQARESHAEAARLARVMGDAKRLAHTALRFGETAYGGPFGEAWRFDSAKVQLLEEALDRLPEEEGDLSARVAARLATSLYFSPFDSTERREQLSGRAVELARGLGDDSCLAYVLNARHLAVWGPDNVEERRALAEELVELAHRAGDEVLEMTGRSWLISDLIELAELDQVAPQIALHASIAERTGYPPLVAYSLLYRAMWALFRGDLPAAEELSMQSKAWGDKLQDDNLVLSHHIQMMSIRSFQGRVDECREHMSEVTRNMPAEAAEMATGVFTVLSGEPLPAGVDMERLHLSVEKWTPAFRVLGLTELALLSWSIGPWPEAPNLYEQLLPHRHRVVLGGRDAVGTPGPVSFYLGVLGATLGRFEEAVDHFEQALGMMSASHGVTLSGLVMVYYAAALVSRGLPEDTSRIEELLGRARGTIEQLGLSGFGRLMDRVCGSAGPAAPRGVASIFRIEGEYATVAFDGKVVRLKASKGVRHLQTLLAAPGRELHVLELSGAGSYDFGREGAASAPVLDTAAKAAYRQRIASLNEDLEEAERNHDPERVSRARAELDFFAAELARAMGLGGRDRREPTAAERARSTVTKALHAALKRIGEVHPGLAAHLGSTVRTGYFCSYRPDPSSPIEWQT